MFTKDYRELSDIYTKTLKEQYTHECGMCSNDSSSEGTNSDMAKQSLYRIVKLAAMLHDLLCKEADVEPWVLSQVSEALSNIESIYSYKDYTDFRQRIEQDVEEIDEETESDLYSSINKGGSSIIDRLRSVLATESTESIEKVIYEAIIALESKK